MSNKNKIEEYKKLLDISIAKASNFESSLKHSDFQLGKWIVSWKEIETMHDVSYLHLMNNICSYSDIRHLHVGFFQGGSLLSCFEGENNPTVYAVDNFFGLKNTEDQRNIKNFLNNVFRLGHQGKFTLFAEDFVHLDLSKIKHKINFHVYDAHHEEEAQFKGIDYFDPIFDDVFMLLVDDFKMNLNGDPFPPAEIGTRRALEKNGYKIHYERILEGPMWNYGHGLFVLEKG